VDYSLGFSALHIAFARFFTLQSPYHPDYNPLDLTSPLHDSPYLGAENLLADELNSLVICWLPDHQNWFGWLVYLVEDRDQ
jgi:hypothetical protein